MVPIENIAQKVMANFGFGRRMHDLKYFEVGFFSIFLDFVINLRAPLYICLEEKNINLM